ncbi:MAG: DUF4397 domain-containing protein [Jiangellaceae bacterium]
MIRPIARTVLAVFVLSLAALVGGAAPSQAAPAEGWIRLAHLSPDTPRVDVYLSSFGRAEEPTVLPGVGYGMFSPYQRVPAGSYTVAMRGEGAPATDPPVLSTTVQVEPDTAKTVAGMGRQADLRLVTLTDDLAAPGAGLSKVRVVLAALAAPQVDVVEANGAPLATDLEFTDATDYDTVDAGPTDLRVESPTTTTEESVDLRAGATYTLVLADASGGLGIVPIQDFAAAGQVPVGGVDAGLGGAAAQPLRGAVVAAGMAALVLGAGLLTVRRRRTREG